MKERRVVIDTNVVHAGLYSADGASFQVLRMIEAGRLTPVLSTAILFEYEEVLRRNRDMLGLSQQEIDDVLDGFCKSGEAIRIHFLWRPQLPDPKDDHVLELAVAAGRAPIVTHNLKHFGPASAFGVHIFTPATILKEMK